MSRGLNIPLYFTPMNLEGVAQKLQALTRAQDGLTRIARVTTQYVGFRAVLNKTITTIKNALTNIKELDKTITNIAVVTNMSQEDLWSRMGQYMGMAKQYGVAVNDVYTVSQLFYQQGLQTAQVMDMTNETLKMAKIAGMDYAEAADAMTVAVRAFNIEMSNAQRVTDVYSALAANFAVSSQEIANAMEKTASSAASVGMSIESTSAFMSVMIQSTRESAQNIGSAMKSIISRYGEMKASPNELLKVDGEDVSYNKVDKALKSIGISIKDAKGQFRDFDDVILELAKKWKTLDNNTQRYIATVMAGNRQQSRFIALVSNTDELNRAMNTVNESQNASLQQTLKTMNSLETKLQQVKSAFTDIYTGLGMENSLRNFYDMVTTMLKNIKEQGLMTIAAIGTQLIGLSGQLRRFSTSLTYLTNGSFTYRDKQGNLQTGYGTKTDASRTTGYVSGSWQHNSYAKTAVGATATGAGLTLVGAYITAKGLTIEDKSTDQYQYSQINTGIGELTSATGTLLSSIGMGAAMGGPVGAIAGAVTGLVTALPNIISGVGNLINGYDYTTTERYAKAIEETKKAQEDYIAARAKASDLSNQISKIRDLETTAYTSTEALSNYQAAMNNLADTYPDLVDVYDANGNAIVDLASAEEKLLDLRLREAQAAEYLSYKQVIEKKGQINSVQSAIGGSSMSRAFGDFALWGMDYNFSEKVYTVTICDDKGNIIDVAGSQNKSNVEKWVQTLTATYQGQASSKAVEGNYTVTIPSTQMPNASRYLAQAGSNVGAGTGVLGQIINFPRLGFALPKGASFDILSGTNSGVFNNDNSVSDFITKLDEEMKPLLDNGTLESFSKYILANHNLDLTDSEVAEKINSSTLLQYWNEYRTYAQKIIEPLQQELNTLYENRSNQVAGEQIALWEKTQYAAHPTDISRLETIGTNSLVHNLVDERLNAILDKSKYQNIGEWAEDANGDFVQKAQDTAEAYASYLYDLSLDDDTLAKMLADAADLTNYTEIEHLAEKYGIDAKDLTNEFWTALDQEREKQTLQARNLLFKQLYGRDAKYNETTQKFEDGNGAYADFGGLETTQAFQALDVQIQDWFNNGSGLHIVSQYAGLLANQMGRIKDLYKNGSTTQAIKEVKNIEQLYEDIASIPDELQVALYDVVAGIEWNSRASIRKAIQEIEEIKAKNPQYAPEFDATLTDLQTALDNVVANVIASYMTYMEQIATMAKESADRMSSAKSGLTLDKALTEYNKFIASSRGDDENLLFNELYKYDTALGKYVYTEVGLSKLVAKDTAALEEASQDAAADLRVFEKLSDMVDTLSQHNMSLDFSNISNFMFGTWGGQDTQRLIELYEDYWNSFTNAVKEGSFTGTFADYIAAQADDVAIAASQAAAEFTAYEMMVKVEEIKSINWKSMAQGNITTQDRAFIGALLGLTSEEIDDWWKQFLAMDAQGRADTYEQIVRDATGDFTSKDKAEAGEYFANSLTAIGNAIDEILKGPGEVLSETTIDLIERAGIASSVVNNRGQLVLDGVDNSIDAALMFLEALKESLDVSDYLDKKKSILSGRRSIVENGVKGTMTAAELQALGYDDFKALEGLAINTASGYKWTGAGAAQQYARLRADSPIQARDFAKVMAAESEYGDYAKILAKTRAITDKLSKETNAEVIKQLQEELALYRDIAGAIQDQGKAFNFMSNNLPTGIQNISDYFENVGKALKSINTAVSDNNGEMAYQDFYNIMSHMESNLTNSSLEGAAEKLREVQKLMDLAAQTAHNVDGTWSVNISQLCQDIGISTDDLGETFTESIHEMAKQQIEWIDAQIALLEGLQILENVDLDGGESAYDQIKEYLQSPEGLKETADEAQQDLAVLAAKLKQMDIPLPNFDDLFDTDGNFIGDETQLKSYIDSAFTYLKDQYKESYDGFIKWLNEEKDWSNATDSGAWRIQTLWEEYQGYQQELEKPNVITYKINIEAGEVDESIAALLQNTGLMSANYNENLGTNGTLTIGVGTQTLMFEYTYDPQFGYSFVAASDSGGAPSAPVDSGTFISAVQDVLDSNTVPNNSFTLSQPTTINGLGTVNAVATYQQNADGSSGITIEYKDINGANINYSELIHSLEQQAAENIANGAATSKFTVDNLTIPGVGNINTSITYTNGELTSAQITSIDKDIREVTAEDMTALASSLGVDKLKLEESIPVDPLNPEGSGVINASIEYSDGNVSYKVNGKPCNGETDFKDKIAQAVNDTAASNTGADGKNTLPDITFYQNVGIEYILTESDLTELNTILAAKEAKLMYLQQQADKLNANGADSSELQEVNTAIEQLQDEIQAVEGRVTVVEQSLKVALDITNGDSPLSAIIDVYGKEQREWLQQHMGDTDFMQQLDRKFAEDNSWGLLWSVFNPNANNGIKSAKDYIDNYQIPAAQTVQNVENWLQDHGYAGSWFTGNMSQEEMLDLANTNKEFSDLLNQVMQAYGEMYKDTDENKEYSALFSYLQDVAKLNTIVDDIKTALSESGVDDAESQQWFSDIENFVAKLESGEALTEADMESYRVALEGLSDKGDAVTESLKGLSEQVANVSTTTMQNSFNEVATAAHQAATQLNQVKSSGTPQNYQEWYAKKDSNNSLNSLDYYLRDNVDQQQLIELFEASGNNENDFYKNVIDLLTDSNKLDKEQLRNYEDEKTGYRWDDLFKDWETLINPTNTNSTAKDGGFTSDTTDNEKVETEIAQVLQQFASTIIELNEAKTNKTDELEQLQDLLTMAINSGNSADAEYYQTEIDKLNADITQLDEAIAELTKIEEIVSALQNSGKSAEEVATALDSAVTAVNNVQTNLNKAGNNITSSSVTSAISSLAQAIRDKIAEIKKIKAGGGTGDGTGGDTGGGTGGGVAKGNVALAKGTLMGELGPELVVANGSYFVAGQNGAEFVDLPDDAIVFNHLQTAQLLKNGYSGRGRAINGEDAALAFAKGSVNGGPALADASAAIAQLKRLRSMWQNLLNSSALDLSRQSGGNGGGGGGSDETKAILHDLDRWYNLMRQIAKLEQQISLEQKQRENMASGYATVDSLEKELQLLEKVQKNYKTLSELQKSYYDARRKDQAASEYSMFFTYDEDGLMQYRDENYHLLEELQAVDVNGRAKLNAKQQVALLKNAGFDVSVLKTNADGTKAENEDAMMENFYSNFDGWIEELDNIYDSYHDYLEKIEDNQQAQTKILEEFQEIQLSTEQMLLQAIEDREQSYIDALQKEYDILRDTSDKYTNGLSEALNKERELYEQNRNDQSLIQLQRQLAILQRSGGSASAIKSLQDQIDSQMQDQYFTERENEINAIKEASDAQLEKMQTQIDLMSESLEYQKEHGLLWNEVNTMMKTWNANMIADFVFQWSKKYESMSATEKQKEISADVKTIEAWIEYLAHHGSFSDWYDTASADIMGRMRQLGATSGQLDGEANQARLRAVAQEAYEKAVRNGATNDQAQKAAEEAIKNYLGLSAARYDAGEFVEEKDKKEEEPPKTTTTTTTTQQQQDKYDKDDKDEPQQQQQQSEQKSEEQKKAEEALKNAKVALVNAKAQYQGVQRTANSFPSFEQWLQENYGSSQSKESLEKMKTSHAMQTRYDKAKEEHKEKYKAKLETYKQIYEEALTAYNSALAEVNKYSEGGEVKYTGLAMVHGSPTKPEAFLSADDRALMKSSIFSNKAKAVVAAMEQFTKFADTLPTKYYNGTTNNMGMTIENVSINLDTGIISDDYDARRAAEIVRDEIVKIARQNTNLSLSRR